VADFGDGACPLGDGHDWPQQVDGFVVVERAKGVVMERDGCDASQAFDELLAQALLHGESVAETAHRIVSHMGE
jgi:AmiR/NasT family two-component response regulator